MKERCLQDGLKRSKDDCLREHWKIREDCDECYPSYYVLLNELSELRQQKNGMVCVRAAQPPVIVKRSVGVQEGLCRNCTGLT